MLWIGISETSFVIVSRYHDAKRNCHLLIFGLLRTTGKVVVGTDRCGFVRDLGELSRVVLERLKVLYVVPNGTINVEVKP